MQLIEIEPFHEALSLRRICRVAFRAEELDSMNPVDTCCRPFVSFRQSGVTQGSSCE